MTNAAIVKTLLASDNQREADDLIAFLDDLTPKDKKDFCVFLQGVRFAQTINRIAAR